MNCSNCSVSIDHVEIIERRAKTGKNAGMMYKARICDSCGTFNFIDSTSALGPLPNETLETLKRIEAKVDEILLKTINEISPTPNAVVNNLEDIKWQE